MSTEIWFKIVYKDLAGWWIWTRLTKIAVDKLCEIKHIIPGTSHVFICPAVMTGYWRKKLGKNADTILTLKAGSCVQKSLMLKLLTVAFVAPLLSSAP